MPSVFTDKSTEPQDADLERVLGRSAAHWRSLKALLAAQYAPLTETWKYSGAKHGWALQFKQKKRAVVYLVPGEEHFVASFAFGEKAVAAARESGLPAAVMERIEAAPKYAEGRGVRTEVRSQADVEIVTRLAAIKMAN